jgi:hypothetical protein
MTSLSEGGLRLLYARAKHVGNKGKYRGERENAFYSRARTTSSTFLGVCHRKHSNILNISHGGGGEVHARLRITNRT